MGWEIVASDPAAGRIEATDTTFWFGFKDDVVVRVAAAPDGSRVDVRSLSRVGLSDVGTNAARIRKYLDGARKTASYFVTPSYRRHATQRHEEVVSVLCDLCVESVI